MIFTGVTGGEIISLLYPLFILSPFCYIIISKESLDGAAYLHDREYAVPSSEKNRTIFCSCRTDLVCDHDPLLHYDRKCGCGAASGDHVYFISRV